MGTTTFPNLLYNSAPFVEIACSDPTADTRMETRTTQVFIPSSSSSFFFYFFFFLFFFVVVLRGSHAVGVEDGSEEWGYVEVRPKAHMFWWLYRSPNRIDDGAKPWPLVLWLQGGPGASGVGIGNFEEIGPLDTNLKHRNSTWLQIADLLFVDNPVGTGYSFVEDKSLFIKTEEEAAADLTTLLKSLFKRNETLQASPLYIVAESYGGKFAVMLGLSLVDAVASGELNVNLGGVVLGDSWISPEDYVSSWGPLLKDMSRLDHNGLTSTESIVDRIKQQIKQGDFADAVESWINLEVTISNYSNNVDFYNFLHDSGMNDVVIVDNRAMERYSSYLSTMAVSNGGLDSLMNGIIKKKLGIIPPKLRWGGQRSLVFDALREEFMKPRISEVDELLSKGIDVTIYNGQVDLICATKGTEAWLQKLRWDGLKNFTNLSREPLYCSTSQATKAFTKSFQNLYFYWILGAGHFVPVDQPCISLKMLAKITQSPTKSSPLI